MESSPSYSALTRRYPRLGTIFPLSAILDEDPSSTSVVNPNSDGATGNTLCVTISPQVGISKGMESLGFLYGVELTIEEGPKLVSSMSL